MTSGTETLASKPFTAILQKKTLPTFPCIPFLCILSLGTNATKVSLYYIGTPTVSLIVPWDPALGHLFGMPLSVQDSDHAIAGP